MKESMGNEIEIEGMVFDAGVQTAHAASERMVATELVEDDLALDRSLLPKRLGDYLGQTRV